MINNSRLQLYLDTMVREVDAIKQALVFSDEEILGMPLFLRGVKYSMVVIAEVIAETCQHILAKEHKTAVSGFSETLTRAASFGIVQEDLYGRLAPFLCFRNMLVHGYWRVDDALFLRNLRGGVEDFVEFSAHIRERYVLVPPPEK